MDSLLRATIADGAVSIMAANTTDLTQQAATTHKLWPVTTAALGRAMTGALLMAAPIKLAKGSVTLIFAGGGPVGNVVAVARPSGAVKGYVENPGVPAQYHAVGKLNVGAAVGKDGTLSVVMDTGRGEPYVGKVELVSGEVAEDIVQYFAYSLQQPTAAYLGVALGADAEVLRAGGVFIQALPNCSADVLSYLEERAAALSKFGDALREGAETLEALRVVFSDQEIKVLAESSPRFECDCSRERMSGALIALGREELGAIAREDDGAQLHCHFCDTYYDFSGDEIKTLMAKA